MRPEQSSGQACERTRVVTPEPARSGSARCNRPHIGIDIHDEVSVHVTRCLAHDLIAHAGITRDERGRWITPDDRWTWATDEALRWALSMIVEQD
jgi:hypothetical protein